MQIYNLFITLNSMPKLPKTAATC